MNPNIDDELREQILTEFKQVHKLAPADYTENCTNVVMSMVTNKIKEAELRGAVNALYQLKADRVAHTLGNHPKDWTPEIDFIDHHIAQLTNQYKGEQDNE